MVSREGGGQGWVQDDVEGVDLLLVRCCDEGDVGGGDYDSWDVAEDT